MIYHDEEAAFLRAEAVRLQGKWWPGVIRHRDGTFELTYDPADEVAPDLPSTPHSDRGRMAGVASGRSRVYERAADRHSFTSNAPPGMERVLP